MLSYFLNKNYSLNDCESSEELRNFSHVLKVFKYTSVSISKLVHANVKILPHRLVYKFCSQVHWGFYDCKVNCFRKTFVTYLSNLLFFFSLNHSYHNYLRLDFILQTINS